MKFYPPLNFVKLYIQYARHRFDRCRAYISDAKGYINYSKCRDSPRSIRQGAIRVGNQIWRSLRIRSILALAASSALW